jgi:hypothetical protein
MQFWTTHRSYDDFFNRLVLSPKSRYEVPYSARLLDRGSDSFSSPTLLVVGTSGSPLRDGRSQGWKMVKDEARESPVRFLEYPPR